MIDFAALVLGPAMDAFGRPITVTPTKSQPGAPAYATTVAGAALTGVYASKKVEIQLENGLFHSTVQPTLGLRLADFAVPPRQGDLVTIPASGLSPALGAFAFADISPDGQGGADCELRLKVAPDGTTVQDAG